MNVIRHVNIVFTGGTIEKVYDEVQGEIGNIAEQIDEFFARLRLPYVQLHPSRLMNIDSLNMTEEHRAKICEKVEFLQGKGYPIVIIHGTDTMVETGRYLQRHMSEIRLPVILTGAMRPLIVENSDGYQNLAESIFATQFLAGGIYIVFHNQVYDIDNVRKNREKKTFERIT
ncbi:MAG: asparaginase [Acidobacteria bacterium]|nr:asparaginase [Acidobacteriota bacterium]